MEYKKHKFNFFPEINKEEFQGLKNSIASGFDPTLGKITLFEGAILDGWNRYKACLQTEIQPVYTEFKGTEEEAFQFSIKANQDRRHLTKSQLAAIAIEAEHLVEAIQVKVEEERRRKIAEARAQQEREKKEREALEAKRKQEAIRAENERIKREAQLAEEEAIANEQRKQYIAEEKARILKEREAETAKEEERKKEEEKQKEKVQLIVPSAKDTTKLKDSKLATTFGTNRQYVADAKKLKETNPEQFEAIKRGEKTITEVKKELKVEKRKKDIAIQRQQIEESDLPEVSGLFDVISVDPPWAYEGGKENSYDPDGRRVSNPYPEMPTEDIKAIELPLKDNAVVFLWTTHKFLPDSFDILKEWGLEYKVTMVWDKQKIGMGSWFRMQCEFCLVGIKGKPFWENTSMNEIISEKRREHSRKPDSFFELVDKICAGRKLEYFSREQRHGWEVFGNDINKF